ncbi:MAG: dehydratase [Sulfobacillus benefaciens]|uniref:Dehydratase n=1 Tax=Sulfobacillus benefaciens TaxID=453960 RepID=A0A2T2XIQ4_9FIRM|nr:MAG: dehydratase [Sulfobacillus benefaciens]
MFDRPFEDYTVGEVWMSRGRTITEADLVMFSAFSGDWYPLHTDKEWARKGPFGQRIAHGMLVLSVSTGLLTMKPGVVLAFYGIDRVRFVAPTYIGDTISVELEVKGLSVKERGGVVDTQLTVKKQTNEPVVVSTLRVLVANKDTMNALSV